MDKNTGEFQRIKEKDNAEKDWLRWGPYLSERQWGTVREDYSADGHAWDYFPHDDARSRTYRWGEDGIAGISDHYCNICFAIALWNGHDPIIKERLFGLAGNEGNHGEDVKELYYYLENTPTHSYMKHLYKYSHNAFPYSELVEENKKRTRKDLEYEIPDTGVFKDDNYFDVFTEYAKADENDILIKITIHNRGKEAAPIHLMPTIWIRNYWSFEDMPKRPYISKKTNDANDFLNIDHIYVGNFNLYFEKPDKLLFTENETNTERIYKTPNDHPFKKDLFNDSVISSDFELASKREFGTKSAPYYKRMIPGQESLSFKLRLSNNELEDPFHDQFEQIFLRRQKESDDFYSMFGERYKNEQRQAFAGILWSKQYYNYDVERWLKGDPKEPEPPIQRLSGRNVDWKTLRIHDVLLMPDKWEYPWFAAWDSAFHCVTMAKIDLQFAKQQLELFTKEWYMSPNGQIPAYEWSFSDVNPPIQAWAALEISKIEKETTGKRDIAFLKRMFNKLTLNFTWWVNRQDSRNNNVFEGGFLGLDNIGVFDRSNGIPGGGILEQVDGTSWMALYCLNMLEISLKIAVVDPVYEDMATKFLGHFVYIAEALNIRSINYTGVWDETEGFFYDRLILPDGNDLSIKVRSISGLLALVAVLNVKSEDLDRLPTFKKSIKWFQKYRKQNLKFPVIQDFADGDDLWLSLVPKDRMRRLIEVLLDEKEFLSAYGIRSLSKKYETPYSINIGDVNYTIKYEPGESSTPMFGGNSNWRGPIWFPINYLFLSSLEEYYSYCGDSEKFEYPTGTGKFLNLDQIRKDISKRLIKLLQPDENGVIPAYNLYNDLYQSDYFKEYKLFFEYFHGDNGRGLGASHQTGWTALIANLIEELPEDE